jgi:hypothetical protein
VVRVCTDFHSRLSRVQHNETSLKYIHLNKDVAGADQPLSPLALLSCLTILRYYIGLRCESDGQS